MSWIEDHKIHTEAAGPDTFPTFYEGRWDDRSDPKWSHPDLRPFHSTTGDVITGIEQWYDVSASKESRIKARDDSAKSMGDGVDMMPDPAVDRIMYTVPGLYEGDPDIPVQISYPKDSRKKRHSVLFAFGQGGMAVNELFQSKPFFEKYCESLGVAVVFAKARTGVDVYFPKPLDEYQAVWEWMTKNADELRLNTDNVVLQGISGGGYTALCFAFRAKRLGYKVKGLMAIGPVMGDDFTYPSSKIVANQWDSVDVVRAFRSIIRPGDINSPYISPEVSPIRATVEDCRGLCPIYIHGYELDADRDPQVAFVEKCFEAKGFAQLHIWGGSVHGGIGAASGRISTIYNQLVDAEIADLFEFDLRRPWLTEE